MTTARKKTTRKVLKREIEAQILPPGRRKNFHAGFIPRRTLKRIMHRKAVKEVLESESERASPDVVEFLYTDAVKLFAALVASDNVSVVKAMFEYQIKDHMLPLHIDHDRRTIKSWNHPNDSKAINAAFTPNLYDMDLSMFDCYQWICTPPIITLDCFRYKFHQGVCLPFTFVKQDQSKKALQGGFADVKEAYICAGHLQDKRLDKWNYGVDDAPSSQSLTLTTADIPRDEHGNFRVAIKTLNADGGNLEEAAQNEAGVLKSMRTIGKGHLINTIAYYRDYDDRNYRRHSFVFPWADKGNLWDFWQAGGNTSRTTWPYIEWAVSQFVGLASAIEELHEGWLKPGTKTPVNCRHGDLKPQNILCFSTRDKGKNGAPGVYLTISDVGLAKEHDTVTQMRTRTRNKATTKRYAPPEANIDHHGLSRRFDVWSMGCILLEFTIWLLFGFDDLKRFEAITEKYHDLPIGQGLNLTTDGSRKSIVNTNVTKCLDELKADRRCSEGTVLHRLIVLIQTELLVVELPDKADEISDERPRAPAPDSQNDSNAAFKMTVRAPTFKSETNSSAGSVATRSSQNVRADSKTMKRRLKAIYDDLMSGKIRHIGATSTEFPQKAAWSKITKTQSPGPKQSPKPSGLKPQGFHQV